MHLDLSDWVQLVIYLFGDYKYESKEIILWQKLAKGQMNILDIGAHVGYYSLLAGSVNNNAVITAVEPTPKTFNNLSENIKRNRYKVTAYNMALGNSKGSVEMQQPDTMNSGMNFVKESGAISSASVAMDTLENFYSAQLNGSDIGLMKIDAEGFEYKILQGGMKMFEACRPVIFIELLNSTLNRFNAATTDVYTLMCNAGYQFYKCTSGTTLEPCNTGEEGEVLILVHESKKEYLFSQINS